MHVYINRVEDVLTSIENHDISPKDSDLKVRFLSKICSLMLCSDCIPLNPGKGNASCCFQCLEPKVEMISREM